MNIKTITIEGLSEDIKISQTDAGAKIVAERWDLNGVKTDHAIMGFARDEDRDAQYAKAVEVAGLVYGVDCHGRTFATDSMIHEVMNAIELVAGC